MPQAEVATADFIGALLRVAGSASRPVPLHEPEFAGNEWDYVRNCIDTGWVSSAGKFVDRFEQSLANYTGAKHAVAMVNGTAALHVALLAAGVKPGDEVMVSPLTFVGTANAIVHCNAVPHFIDCEEPALGLSPHALEKRINSIAEISSGQVRNRVTGRRIAAIVPMHVFGHSCDMPRLLSLASDWDIPVVEDAAEAIGSRLQGKHLGTFGAMGVLSFNGNKIVTTGGGGAVLTESTETAQFLRHITTTAKVPHPWQFIHDAVAFNYRMPNLNAALGCAQLERLDDMIERKRVLTAAYKDAFADVAGLRVLDEPEGSKRNFWLNAVVLDGASFSKRDALIQAAIDAGVCCRPVWRLLHKLEMYKDCPRGDLSVAEALEARLINVPSSATLAGAAQRG